MTNLVAFYMFSLEKLSLSQCVVAKSSSAQRFSEESLQVLEAPALIIKLYK